MEKYTNLEQALQDKSLAIVTDALATQKELNNIDRCFVNEDADGVKEIMKNAEANAEFTNYDKMKIVNECNLALVDLRLMNAPSM